MRRLLRWLFNGLCLLSLLACLGTAWLWWRGKRFGAARVDVAALGSDVQVGSTAGGLFVEAVEDWPGPAGVRLGEDLPAFSWPTAEPPRVRWRVAGILFESRQASVFLRADGTPQRFPASGDLLTALYNDGPGDRWSDPLPYQSAGGAPQWLAVGLFAVPPLLWLAARSRRLYARRRRRRLGLCVRCGYDLTGNTSGKCSECGERIEAVTAERRVTA